MSGPTNWGDVEPLFINREQAQSIAAPDGRITVQAIMDHFDCPEDRARFGFFALMCQSKVHVYATCPHGRPLNRCKDENPAVHLFLSRLHRMKVEPPDRP